MKLIEHNEAVNSPEKPLAYIEELKKELLSIREVKLKGHMIRSRAQWLQCGEKPTKYFCRLEHKNFVDKTMKKIRLENGKTVTKQSEILQEVKHYYSNLFKRRDDNLNSFKLNKLMKGVNITKLNKIDATSLEGPLTTDELGHALRNMKHNKTPGIDGFPAESLKMFWCKVKYLITRVLNKCYETGILLISLRQTIINCIPKGDKSRDSLKNWRPISLLSTFYKLASACLATRMKNILDTLISDSQTGFVKGRYIGESIRLVYDIMNYTEVNKTDGLLMLIDFEKAFDSISWKFMYNVLDIFGFPQSYIKWVKLLNTSIVGAVVQAGVKSEFLKIERGCKQGDPIAPYLFILCGQILTYMIKDNNKIKGIYIGGHQFKITQFADDTTLFLNGTQNCLQAALNTLELFGSFSGLKMNTSKTKVIWIGRKKHMVEKLNVNSKLQWGTDRFNLLGIQFSVDLELIPSLNYNKAMDDACKLLNVWKKRNLTPFGKITIIKTFVLSKFNHLFNSLPSPADNFVKKINSVLFSYLWENKPDKIKRSYVTLDYCKGGLQMIDLCSHIQSAKLMWMTRILQGRPSSWQLLFECNISPIFKLSKFGYGWCKCILKSIKNNFWKDVLQAWVGLCENLSIETSEQLLSSPIWYNPRISSTTLYYPKWFRHGIESIGDVIDTNAILITEHKLKNKSNLPCINFLEMTRLKLLIKKYIQKCNIILQDFRRPNIPREMEIVNSHTKSKDFYKLINTRYPEIGIKHSFSNDEFILQIWKL